MSRRHVLRGLGVSMALPLLDCMQPLRAANKASRPRRSIFIYLPNGVNTNDYAINETGADYKLSRILSPLEKHRANITPVSGLYHPNSFGIAHKATQTWLTVQSTGPTDRNTISVDQLMAQVTGPKTRFPSLELSNQGHRLAVSADGIKLPPRKTRRRSSRSCSRNLPVESTSSVEGLTERKACSTWSSMTPSRFPASWARMTRDDLTST